MTTPTAEFIAGIDETEAICKAATPGPWTCSHRDIGVADDEYEAEDRLGLGWEVQGPPVAWNRGQFQKGYDAHLIAHARTKLPEACAAMKGLIDDLKKLRHECRQSNTYAVLGEFLRQHGIEPGDDDGKK